MNTVVCWWHFEKDEWGLKSLEPIRAAGENEAIAVSSTCYTRRSEGQSLCPPLATNEEVRDNQYPPLATDEEVRDNHCVLRLLQTKK